MSPMAALLKSVTRLSLADSSRVELSELIAEPPASISAGLAAALASMDPWRRYGFSVERLQAFVGTPSPGTRRYLVTEDDSVLGLVVLKPGWMFGTYLNFLAVLPQAQGRGIGGALLDWMRREGETRGERNQFVATSAFNAGALRFYERHGFVVVATMPGLINDDETEILLRRRLLTNP